MNFIIYFILGTIISILGSIMPSMLNLTVVKISIKSGRKEALYLALGISSVLLFQSNIGAFLASILMKNSEYIATIQQVATGIIFLISVNFFRLYFKNKDKPKKEKIQKSKAFMHGFVLSSLNMFAIPFYFTVISILIGLNFFNYSIPNSIYFSIGSIAGSFLLYTIYAFTAKAIEKKILFMANKMDLILGVLTGFIAIINALYLI